MKQPHPSMRTTSARRGLVAGGVFLLLILGLVIGATVAAARGAAFKPAIGRGEERLRGFHGG